LAAEKRHGPVDLIYTTNMPADAFIENIRQLAEKAGVRFHLLVTKRDRLLTLDRLERMIPGWKEAEICFCGPQASARRCARQWSRAAFPKTISSRKCSR
jgi:predicted ferric reductase